MNAQPCASFNRPWTWQRWTLYIGLAFAAHIGFILAFGDRRPVVRRVAENAPALQFTTPRWEQEQLDNPTLFALPHPNGFGGAAWLRRPQFEFAPFRWIESPRLLALAGAQLGATYLQRTETNHLTRLELETLPPPELTERTAPDPKVTPARRSSPSFGGELAHRQWLNAPGNLPSWPAADLLTNSVVQVWVEADGQILSPALLLPGSGSKEADQLALKLARGARFTPQTGGAAKPSHGWLIFDWNTVPTTNATAPPP